MKRNIVVCLLNPEIIYNENGPHSKNASVVGRSIFRNPCPELVNSLEFKADFRTCVTTNVKTT